MIVWKIEEASGAMSTESVPITKDVAVYSTSLIVRIGLLDNDDERVIP